MAIRTFNSVGGFSVGETPETIILANGDITTDYATFTANVSAGNLLTNNLLYANGVPWDFISAGGLDTQIQFNDGGELGGVANFAFDKTSNTLTLNGTANLSKINTSNVVSTGNITAPYFIGNVIGNISGTITVPGNNTAVLFNNSGNADASDNLKFNFATNVLTVTGNVEATYFKGNGSELTNINGGNVSEVANAGYATIAGTAYAVDGGNVSGNVATAVTAYTAYSVSGANVSGNVATSVNAYNAYSVDGGNVNGTVGSATVAYSVDGANVSGNVATAVTAYTAYSVAGGNVDGQVGNALIAGTVYTNAQPNITSVGTLTSLTTSGDGKFNFDTDGLVTISTSGIDIGKAGRAIAGSAFIDFHSSVNDTDFDTRIVSTGGNNSSGFGNLDLYAAEIVLHGNIDLPTYTANVGNLNVATAVTSNLVPSNNNTFTLGNTGSAWKDLFTTNVNVGTAYIRSIGNVLQIDALNAANNISGGTITSRGDADMQGNVTIAGNLTVSGSTTYINVSELSVNDPIISLGGSNSSGNASSYDGKDRGLYLRNYKSGGSGPVNMFMGWDTGNGEFALGSNVTVSGEVVSFTEFGNIRLDQVIGNLTGQVLTASQTNITTVGTLTNLQVSGNLQVDTVANVNSLVASGLSYPAADGTVGQVLTTYGNGVLYFKSISSSALTNGTSNVDVVNNGNVNISSGGTANVLVVTSTGANVTGTFNSTGAATVDKLVVGNTSVQAATIETTSTSKTTIVTVSTTGVRAVEFFVKAEESLGGKYSVATVSAVHNGTDVDYAVYGTVILGGATGVLEVNKGTGTIKLDVTPASSNSTFWTVQYRTI